jgi:uncharacterized protein (TIGR02599 family)
VRGFMRSSYRLPKVHTGSPKSRRGVARRRSPHSMGAFSLIEVLATLAMLLIIFVVLLQFVTDVGHVWKAAAEDPFAEAENAFEVMARNFSGATLETYQDYADVSGAFRTGSTTAFSPDHLARRSDLDFVCAPGGGANGLLATSGRLTTGSAAFFIAPRGYTQTYAHEGMERLLNAVGYFVEFGNDDGGPSFFSGHSSWRWRLKEVVQPAESLSIFASSSPAAWIRETAQTGNALPVLAENIVTLIVLPERAANDSGEPLSPDFRYDSQDAGNPLTRNQLPPRVRLVLVAMDEASAQRLAAQYGVNPPPLVPGTLFREADHLDADIASLDAALTAQKVNHRILQRHILLPSSAWSDSPSS